MTRHLICCALIAPLLVFAQEAENPPTLKLDRIPSLPAFAGQTRAPAAPESAFRIETLAEGLGTPWALAFLPDGEMLVSEYADGRLRLIDADGKLSQPISGLPEISHEGWAGLFDIALDPDFGVNRYLYFSYTAPSGNPDSPNIPRVARARFERNDLRLADVDVLLDGMAWQELHFAPDGHLLVSGTGTDRDANGQDLGSYSGKLLRLLPDGGIPRDNPWSTDESVPSLIYTYGHRDISGMATHPDTGEIWISEHGARGGDELNVIRAGANYGWPVISYGTEYSGAPVGEGGTSSEGMEQPRYFWRPSIAPSGLMFYTGDLFPEWRGNLFVTALSGQHIARLVLDGDRVIAEERLLVANAERIRELRQGPDGALYALTNEESDAPKGTGRLLRIYR
ncbi:MAG: PQQ-dependent sugar dehydrogenase [Gammaproteobacteria bacterium]|nr:PQQ-dependent sugar dehydrogenase [Gammaproteobacteria bacterium]